MLQVHPHLQGCCGTGAPQKQLLHRLQHIVKRESFCSSARLPVKPQPAASAAGPSASAGLLWDRGSAETGPAQQLHKLLSCKLVGASAELPFSRLPAKLEPATSAADPSAFNLDKGFAEIALALYRRGTCSAA